MNALLNAPGQVENGTMYIYPFGPCAQCSAAIIQRGLEKVVYFDDHDLCSWERSQKEGMLLLHEAGIPIYNFCSHLDDDEAKRFRVLEERERHWLRIASNL
jgi:dCMP deaminase